MTHHFVLVMSHHHLYHLLSLHALITAINLGPSASFIVTDTFGYQSGLQLLKAVALRAVPLINLLWAEESMSPSESFSSGRNRSYAKMS